MHKSDLWMSRLKLVAINVVVFVAVVVVILVIGEVGARVWLARWADDEAFDRYASLRQWRAENAAAPDPAYRYSPHRYLGYYPTPGYREAANYHNRLGYRGDELALEKLENEFRIVCLGGSTTYTSAVSSPKWSYPHLLEKELWDRGHKTVTVVNAGAEGWTSYESLINFQLRVVELDPDIIIVYHGANDIMARFVYPTAYYAGDNSGNRGPNVSDVVMPAIWEHSTLLRIVGINANWTLPHAHLARTLVQALPTDVSHIWAKQVMDGVYPDGIFEEMSVRELFEVNPPTYFRRNIKSLIASARLNGTQTVLATFAYTPEKNASPFGNHPDFVWTYEESNEILKALAATEEGAHLYDFAAEFPKEPKWWADELHVNYDGAELKAKMFADYLEASGLIPE